MLFDILSLYVLCSWWTLSGGFSKLTVSSRDIKNLFYLYFTMCKLQDTIPLEHTLSTKGLKCSEFNESLRLLIDLKVLKEIGTEVTVINEDYLVEILCSELGDTVMGNMYIIYKGLGFPAEKRLEELATLLFLYKVFNHASVGITGKAIDYDWLGKLVAINAVPEMPRDRVLNLLSVMRTTAVGGRL